MSESQSQALGTITDVKANVAWANEVTFSTAVQLREIAIDGSRPAPLLEVRASPNSWVKPIASVPATISPRKELYRRFFQPLPDELRSKHFTNAKAAQPQSWYTFTSGTRGFNYTVEFSTGNRLRAGLYIDTQTRGPNKAAFDFFEAKKIELQTKIGAPIEWERLNERRACRISVARPNSSIDQVTSEATDARNWVIKQLFAFKAAFGPLIPAAAQAAEIATAESEPPLNAMDES